MLHISADRWIWVGRNILPSIPWAQNGWSEYSINEVVPNRWFVIAVISNLSFEAVSISKSNTNRTVFANFLKILIDYLKIRFWDWIYQIILNSDGTRYHSAKEVDRVLKENKMWCSFKKFRTLLNFHLFSSS